MKLTKDGWHFNSCTFSKKLFEIHVVLTGFSQCDEIQNSTMEYVGRSEFREILSQKRRKC